MKCKYLTSLLLPVLCATPLFGLTSCGNSRLVFATYESYLSPELIRKHQNDVDILYYSNDGDIRQKFRQSYDVATPSTSEALLYMQSGWLAQIDWLQFGIVAKEIYNERTDNYLKYADPSQQESLQNITCGKDAEYLLAGNPLTDFTTTDEEHEIEVLIDQYHVVQAMNTFSWNSNFFPQDYYATHTIDNCSIMDYFIPYFLQDYSFGYKGNKIMTLDENVQWTDILDATGKGESHDRRFDGRNNNKLLTTDDLRTSFDMSQIVKWEKADPATRGELDIVPTEDGIGYFENTYDNFFSPFYGTKEILLNSDGGQLVSAYCNSQNSSNGIFSYNGDVLLASLGNGEREAERNLANQWYDYAKQHIDDDTDYLYAPQHIVSPDDNVLAFDVVVINEKSIASKSKDIYNFIYKTILDHLDYGCGTSVASSADDTEWYDDPNQIWAWNDNTNSYQYDTMTNFDYIYYTSPWTKINQYVAGYQYDRVGTEMNYEYHGIDCGADYGWESAEQLLEKYTPFDIDTEDELCEPWVNMLHDAYCINVGNTYKGWIGDVTKCIEDPISDLAKSNMHWGYSHMKEKL